MRDKPQSCYDARCPLAITCRSCGHDLEKHPNDGACAKDGCSCREFSSLGRGFVLGSGDPLTAKFAAILEAPGREEIAFLVREVKGRQLLGTKEDVEKEIAIRRRDYPGLPEPFLRVGAPAVGRTGAALDYWIWPKVGLSRKDFYLDNTLRCLPPKKATGAYPTGKDKQAAERACRMYDRIEAFRPDTLVFTLHPAGILREITPLPLAVKDMERVRDFAQAGRRVAVLLGGKSTGAFARYGTNVTKWRGHYALLGPDWGRTYKSLFEFKAKEKKPKEYTTPKEKKPPKPKKERKASTGPKRVIGVRVSRKKRMEAFDDVFSL